jgi:hypothetical protein
MVPRGQEWDKRGTHARDTSGTEGGQFRVCGCRLAEIVEPTVSDQSFREERANSCAEDRGTEPRVK